MPIGGVRAGYLSGVKDAIPDSGVARYEFEQDLTDSFGSNDLTDNTSEGYRSALAPIGSFAKSFNGSDDYAIADSPVIDMTSGVAQSIVGFMVLDDSTTGFRGLIDQNDDNNGFRFTANDKINVKLENNDSVAVDTSAPKPSAGTVFHFGFTKDTGDNCTFYIDGGVEDTGVGASGSEPLNTNFGRHPPSADYADMGVDLVDVYNKELSQTDVQNHRDTGSISG